MISAQTAAAALLNDKRTSHHAADHATAKPGTQRADRRARAAARRRGGLRMDLRDAQNLYPSGASSCSVHGAAALTRIAYWDVMGSARFTDLVLLHCNEVFLLVFLVAISIE